MHETYAPLQWERRSYMSFDAEASEQVLWDYARRYWLCDKLMLLSTTPVRLHQQTSRKEATP